MTIIDDAVKYNLMRNSVVFCPIIVAVMLCVVLMHICMTSFVV